jgi:hypothetical protein
MGSIKVIACLAVILACCVANVAAKDKESMSLDRFPVRIEFRPEDAEVAKYVARISGKSLPLLQDEIGLKSIGPIEILIVPRADVFEKENRIDLPDWGAAFAFMQRQVMVVDVEKAASAWNALEHTIPHELSHLLLYQKTAGVRLPIWFVEGMAMWQAGEWSMGDDWHLMNSVWKGDSPPLRSLVGRFPARAGRARNAYRVAYKAFVETFGEAGPAEGLPELLDLVVRNKDFDAAFAAFYGKPVAFFYGWFDAELMRKYTSHLLLFQTGPLLSILAVFFLIVVVRVKLRNRRKLKQFERMEQGLSLDDR